MKLASFLAVLTLTLSPLGSLAATLAPVRAYVKPGEPVNVQFLQPAEGKAEEVTKTTAAIGLEAVKLPGLFAAAPLADVANANGEAQFALYTMEGKALEGKKVKLDTGGTVDLLGFFPQLADAGTYVLAWKDAQPLVIEVLRPAIPWGPVKNDYVPAEVKRQIEPTINQLKNSPPIVTHIVPLTYALIATEKGDIKASFDYVDAPNTVDNFVSLAKQGYYTSTNFHRIIKGFMIQGGDSLGSTPDRAGSGGPGFNQAAELSSRQHVRGVLSMARTGLDVNTAGGQFFIVHGKAEFLDGAYTVFGQVIDGLPIVDKLAETPVADANGTVTGHKPTINSITILPATLEQYGIKK